MKNRIRIYATALVVGLAGVLLSTSCDNEEFLQQEQGSTAFSEPRNTQDLELLIEGAYYAMGGNGGWRGVINAPILVASFTSDEGWLPVGPEIDVSIRDDARNWYNRDLSNRDNSQMERLWEGGYGAISNINLVIDFIDPNQDGEVDNQFDDKTGADWTPRILGEAYFLRAFNYWLLVKQFGPPPTADADAPSVLLRAAPPASAFDNPAPAPVSEVYDLIVSDLNKAVELLPAEYDNTRDPEAYQDRVFKAAANFQLARVHLMLNNFDQAAQNATAVIESGLYDLQDEVLDAWDDRELGAIAPEVIWQYVTYNSGQQRWKPPIVHRYIGYTDGNGNPNRLNNNQQLSLAQTLVEDLGWDDPAVAELDERHNDFYIRYNGDDPRETLDELNELRIWPNKWYRSEYTGWGSSSITSLPLMRLSEMYLTRALVRLRDGDAQGAADDLNVVKERAWDGDPANFTPVTASEITEDMIHLERMIELAFEGDRVWYLQALSQDIPAGDRIGENPYPFGQLYAPIPIRESDVNPNVD